MLDVIILSNAKSRELTQVTANCLDSLLDSNSELNVFVVEQNHNVDWSFGNTRVRNIYLDQSFNYNQFANIGVKHGKSEWICIANNDLIFEPNWFREILKANHPICSPRCPDDKRQREIFGNEIGEQVGRHLSGWCFVIKRSLWEAIGGFDEDFSFWCADNSLMEQLLAIGIKPMVVEYSMVRHLGSKTLVTMENREELTRDQVKKFNKKYNKNLFGWGT
jgi:GT2 family glycosyltransferase